MDNNIGMRRLKIKYLLVSAVILCVIMVICFHSKTEIPGSLDSKNINHGARIQPKARNISHSKSKYKDDLYILLNQPRTIETEFSDQMINLKDSNIESLNHDRTVHKITRLTGDEKSSVLDLFVARTTTILPSLYQENDVSLKKISSINNDAVNDKDSKIKFYQKNSRELNNLITVTDISDDKSNVMKNKLTIFNKDDQHLNVSRVNDPEKFLKNFKYRSDGEDWDSKLSIKADAHGRNSSSKYKQSYIREEVDSRNKFIKGETQNRISSKYYQSNTQQEVDNKNNLINSDNFAKDNFAGELDDVKDLLLPMKSQNNNNTQNRKPDMQYIQSNNKKVKNENNYINSNSFAEDNFAGGLEDVKYLPLPMKSQNNAKLNTQDVQSNNKNISNSESQQDSEKVRIVSMSLYGSDRRYIVGALRNAEIIKRYFPGWTLRIYALAPGSSTKFSPLPNDVVESLRNLDVDIQYVTPNLDFVPPMMWRFLVADDLSVDRFIIRDSDSRLSDRDFACVKDWIQSGKALLSIRDHPSHAGYSISGGLWGGRPSELRNILRKSWVDLMRGHSGEYFSDMSFLDSVIWPKAKGRHVYSCDSVSCKQWPNSFPFPVERRGYEHVGAVFDENDLMRPVDIKILMQARENVECSPNNSDLARYR